jgi:hypothetical protein
LAVVFLEVAHPLGRRFEPAQQGCLGGSLSLGGQWCRGRRLSARSQGLDLGSNVLLRVEPGPGDAGLGGDGLEGDRFAGLVEAPQRAHRAGAGLFGSLPGGGGQMS